MIFGFFSILFMFFSGYFFESKRKNSIRIKDLGKILKVYRKKHAKEISRFNTVTGIILILTLFFVYILEKYFKLGFIGFIIFFIVIITGIIYGIRLRKKLEKMDRKK